MPLRPLEIIPKDIVQWNNYLRAAHKALSPGEIGAVAQLGQTTSEKLAGVQPVNVGFAEGYVNRYGNNTSPGTTIMTAAIRNAIAVAQQANVSVVFQPRQVYAVDDTITISGANRGITLMGELFAGMQQGSAERNATIRYVGSAARPLFQCDVTYTQFRDLSLQNAGNATYAIIFNPGGRALLDRVTISLYDALSRRFSTAAIRFAGGSNYDFIRDCECVSGAPVFCEYDGLGGGSTGTSLYFEGGVYEAVAAGDLTVVRVTNGAPETLSFEKMTFNGQGGNDVTVADCDAIGSYEIDNLILDTCEYDSGEAAAVVLKCRNVRNVHVRGCTVYGAGVMTHAVELVNSVLHLGPNTWRSVAGPLVSADANSRIFYYGPQAGSSFGGANGALVNNATTTTGIVNVPYAAVMSLHGQLGNPGGHTVYEITPTNGNPFTIAVAGPTDSTPGYMTRGQIITVTIRNTTGGALGAVTFTAGGFKVGGAWTQPANGFSRSITFVMRATHLVELSRSPADVPNE